VPTDVAALLRPPASHTKSVYGSVSRTKLRMRSLFLVLQFRA